MNIHRLAASVVVRAPAKINLFFEVLGKRSDGFHEIETLMVPITLYDTLVASTDASNLVRVECRWASLRSGDESSLGALPSEHENLATKALNLLRTRSGVTAGIRIELLKHIPSCAGLGGGSSDAAAALLAGNEIWKLGWSRAALAELAAELGSDVPFFLSHGAAICRGRGERIEPVSALGVLHVAVVRPPEGLSTADVYRHSTVAPQPRSVTPLVAALRAGNARGMKSLVHNRLASAAAQLSPWIGRLEQEFLREDCWAAQMSGSGTGYFGVCRHARHARRVARRLQARGLGHAYAVSTSN